MGKLQISLEGKDVLTSELKDKDPTITYDQRLAYDRPELAALNDYIYNKTNGDLMPTGDNLEIFSKRYGLVIGKEPG